MTFALTDEQLAMRETVTSFARERMEPHAIAWDRDSHFPVDVIRETAALGLGGIVVGDNVGGSALTRVDSVLIFEALSRGCPSVAAYLSVHNMVAWMIDRFGSEAQRRDWLPALCRLDHLASYCLTEPGSGSDAAALQTKAVREGGDYIVSGVKQFISGGGAADVYLVMARTGGEGPAGISALLIPKGTPGLSFGQNERKMGWNSQPTRQVILSGCRVPMANRLGEEGQGFRFAMAGLDGGRLNIGACSVGGASLAFDKAVAYMRERKAFGRPIAEFQALQFEIADMAGKLEIARSMLWRAAAALDAKAADATTLCAIAKRFATDAGFEVANAALQLHGGYGYLSDYGIEKIVRDLRVHQILEGTNEIMRVIVARSLLGGGGKV